MQELIQIPVSCPACNADVTTINMQLFCTNKSCVAVVDKQLRHFVKVLGIKGLGDKTIEKLGLSSIAELYQLSMEDIQDAVGSEKVAIKLVEQLELSKHAELHKVIASFGIPLVGNTAGQKLVQVISSIDDITVETCKEAGLGEKVTTNLLQFLNEDFKELREFLPFSFSCSSNVTQENVISNGNICITGKLTSFKTKKEAESELVKLGFTITATVTKTTNFLVDEGEKNSAKRTKADSMGIDIITDLSQFIKEKNI